MSNIYKDIAARTSGEIYIGVVGPVRTGKSTFIKRFMQSLVLPNIKEELRRERATDELPQSASGKTIMTNEPKFIPEQAVNIVTEDGVGMRVRLIDCVGYIVDGALGHIEDEQPRMVVSPWYEEPVAFDVAAETGTKKVIEEHSTVGIVVTTDGSISNIPRRQYEQAEKRVIDELKALGKPFAVLLNCVNSDSKDSKALAKELSLRYEVPVLPVNCLTMDESQIADILTAVTEEFPISKIYIELPKWINTLPDGHGLKESVYASLAEYAASVKRVSDTSGELDRISANEFVQSAERKNADLGSGTASVSVALLPELFFKVIGEVTGLDFVDESSLLPCVAELVKIRNEYRRIKKALDEVDATGYGIVMPTGDELTLEEPEIIRQGGRFGVKLRASAPSIHLMRADITTTVNPIVGSERQSRELMDYLMKEFEDDPVKLWQSDIFGKSLNDLVNEGLQNKLYLMPPEARTKLQQTLERIINDGCNGLLCLIL